MLSQQIIPEIMAEDVGEGAAWKGPRTQSIHKETHPEHRSFYPAPIEDIRRREYPTLASTTYLDHAGTTPYATSLVTRFSQDLVSNLYGNPHSSSSSSQLSTRKIEDIRHDALRYFNADPVDFDLVFVANATAGIKLVMEAFREEEGGFWYGYHGDAHTSLIGAREAARRGSQCFENDEEVEKWLKQGESARHPRLGLFAYPAQSNMNGRRLPLEWCWGVRHGLQTSDAPTYTLLDAAGLVSTSPLDLSDRDAAPDFTVLSFYKIFGFPDLGALIVRKESADILRRRAYFGGGTVDMVVCLKEQWHARKTDSIHEGLEDGTLPVHDILALGHAMSVHKELYGSMQNVSRHTAYLAKQLYAGLSSLKHGNGSSVCEIYGKPEVDYQDSRQQGPIVAFNIRDAQQGYLSTTEVEKLATIRGLQLRTGGLCNPGGVASALNLAPWEMKQNFSAGQRCGNENDVISAKPTGMIRVSLGAMSTQEDVDTFLAFMHEFFVDSTVAPPQYDTDVIMQSVAQGDLYIESMTVYPIKSCAGFRISDNMKWVVHAEGLAWDREWCLVHQGTGAALSQKRYPRMALLRPNLDLRRGKLHIRFAGHLPSDVAQEIEVPLSADPRVFDDKQNNMQREQTSMVCGDKITAKAYNSPLIAAFFTAALGVPCTLARFPPSGSGLSLRHAKAHLRKATSNEADQARPILLSNESPILVISRSSLNRLNEQVKASGNRAPQAEVFRANIVVAQSLGSVPGTEIPYAEDEWSSLAIGFNTLQQTMLSLLGPCRRCQMVCVDQASGDKEASGEPFVTLAKTRRWDGKVWFGVHACLEGADNGKIQVGDLVISDTQQQHQFDS
jgi:molybdenum cofactor sulfurtransferase